MTGDILRFLESNNDSLSLPFTPLDDIDKVLREIGFEFKDSDTNGWQVDFWNYYTHPIHGEYVLSGSLYYGEFQFYKKDD